MGSPRHWQFLAAIVALLALTGEVPAQSQRVIDAIIRNEDGWKIPEAEPPPPAGRVEYQRWEGCLIEHTKRFAPTNEAAEVVVRASMAACKHLKKNFATALFASGAKTAEIVATLTMIEKELSDSALVGVLEIRARNSPPPTKR